MISRLAQLACLALPLIAFAGCSSADSSSGGGAGAIPAAFSKYCIGTLKTEQKIMHPMGPGAWMGTGDKVGAGAQILIAPDFGSWGAFLMDSNGGPLKVSPADHSKGLVRDVDFTADCAPAAIPSFSDPAIKRVTLGKATLYANKELTGTACTLDAGTEFSSYMYSGGGDVAEVSAAEIKTKCSFDKAYTKDLLVGELIAVAAPSTK